MTHYPPLFPLLLAAGGVGGFDPMTSARWLNAVVLGLNLILVGIIIYRYTVESVWISVLGVLAMLTSFIMLRIHSTALSEPIFILYALFGLLSLDVYRTKDKPIWLFLSAASVALAFLSRYTGAALVITGALLLFFQIRKNLYKRIQDVFLFAVLSCFPLLIWVVRNHVVGGTLANRQLVLHPITWENIELGLETLSRWFYPAKLTPFLRDIVLLAALIILLTLILLPTYLKAHQKNFERIQKDNRIPYAFIAFAFIYVVFLFISISFFDAGTPLDIRVFAPLFVACLVAICFLIYRLLQAWRSLRYERHLRLAMLCGCLLFLLAHLAASGYVVWKSHQDGLGYASRKWKQSAVIEYIWSQPEDVLIYSNGADALHLLTGRCVRSIPAKFSAVTLQRQDNYFRGLESMRNQLSEHDGLLVYFRLIDWRDYMPLEEELLDKLSLEPVVLAEDGAIYKMQH